MLKNINTTKVYKLSYICAIIYDFFYWINNNNKKKIMILFHMYSTKFSKAANFRAHRCGP